MNITSGYHAVSTVLGMLFKGFLISQYIKSYTIQGFWQTVCEKPPLWKLSWDKDKKAHMKQKSWTFYCLFMQISLCTFMCLFSHLIHHWFNFWQGRKFAFVITTFNVYGKISRDTHTHPSIPHYLMPLLVCGGCVKVAMSMSEAQACPSAFLKKSFLPVGLLNFPWGSDAAQQHSLILTDALARTPIHFKCLPFHLFLLAFNRMLDLFKKHFCCSHIHEPPPY